MTKANGTDAKDIALYFLGQIKDKSDMNRGEIARTINLAKQMLLTYTKQDILDCINLVLAKKTNIYSLGFISTALPDLMKELETERLKEKAKSVIQEQERLAKEMQGEVKRDHGSAERNKQKAERIRTGFQSRFGEKHHFDMFEGK